MLRELTNEESESIHIESSLEEVSRYWVPGGGAPPPLLSPLVRMAFKGRVLEIYYLSKVGALLRRLALLA